MLQAFRHPFRANRSVPDEQTCNPAFPCDPLGHGAFCPYCGSAKIYHFSDDRTHKCVIVATFFPQGSEQSSSDTQLPLRAMVHRDWLITSHKKGSGKRAHAAISGHAKDRMDHAASASARRENRIVQKPLEGLSGR